jgi:hypothetical protein
MLTLIYVLLKTMAGEVKDINLLLKSIKRLYLEWDRWKEEVESESS